MDCSRIECSEKEERPEAAIVVAGAGGMASFRAVHEGPDKRAWTMAMEKVRTMQRHQHHRQRRPTHGPARKQSILTYRSSHVLVFSVVGLRPPFPREPPTRRWPRISSYSYLRHAKSVSDWLPYSRLLCYHTSDLVTTRPGGSRSVACENGMTLIPVLWNGKAGQIAIIFAKLR